VLIRQGTGKGKQQASFGRAEREREREEESAAEGTSGKERKARVSEMQS